MKTTILTILFLCFISNVLCQSNVTAPKIIRSIPDFGQCDVDTSLKEIQFEFDQDMNGGYSFLDGPNSIPIIGKPVWKTKRLLVASVELKSNKTYYSYINSSRFRGFSNLDGIPMDASYFVFRTKANIDSSKIDTASNKSNFDNFCNYFLKSYSYKDLKGTNWENEFNIIRNSIIQSPSADEFGIKLLKVLRKANDPHLSLIINKTYFSSADFRITPISYNYDAIFNKLSNICYSSNSMAASGNINNIGFIAISTLRNEFISDINFAIEKLNEMKNYPFLILDLRNNDGGNDGLAELFVGNLLTNSISYEKDTFFNEITGKYDKNQIRTLSPNSKSIKYQGQIYVLINEGIISSAESFILMLNQMSNVKLIGYKTYGSSGNPKPYKINDSITVNIPSWRAYDMNGKLIEGNGIEPETYLDYPEDSFQTNDAIFDFIVNKLIKTNISKDKFIENIFVYPNPVKDYLTISNINLPKGEIRIELTDLTGNIILDKTFNQLDINNLTLNLNPYHLKSDVYLLRFTHNDNSIVRRIIMK